MLISSYVNLPFGRWVYFQYPAIVEVQAFRGKVRMGSDVLFWIGHFEVVIARNSKKSKAWNLLTALSRLSRVLLTPRAAGVRDRLASQYTTP